MKFRDIPQYTRARYEVDHSLKYIPHAINKYIEDHGLNMNPDFQRAHVWTQEKQIKYIEYILRGGVSGKDIYMNHPNWMGNFKGEMVLVDGKQRLQAVLLFMDNKLPIFNGVYLNDFEDTLAGGSHNLHFYVNNLKTRKEVLQWYLDLNDGGVVHTDEELDKVRELLKKEK